MISGLAGIWFILLVAGTASAQGDVEAQLSTITLPPGFRIELYTNDSVSGARTLAVGGTESQPIVYASSNSAGVISAIVDRDESGSPVVCTLLRGLNNPQGLVYHNGSIYVGQITNVTRYDDVDAAVLNNCTGLGDPVLLAEPFPGSGGHNSRHIELGPDDKLYISYGSPSNVDTCELYGDINACSIVRMNLDGTELENYVVGVRNSVGFTWHPDTDQFFFNMIERDLMGDDRPDDLLYKGEGIGSNYTWPYCHRQGLGDPYNRTIGPGDGLADPDVFNEEQVAIQQSDPENVTEALDSYCNSSTIAPLMALGPHVTPIGLRFYTGSMFPAEYNRSLFIPERGSWNRGFKIGYRVVNVKLNAEYNVTDHQIFASGWLQNEDTVLQSNWGRPIATAQLPDGSLLLSDDTANVVYRISYEEPTSTPTTARTSGTVEG